MSTEFPKNRLPVEGLKHAQQDKHRKQENLQAEPLETETPTSTPTTKAVPAEQIFEHMSSAALSHAAVLKQQAQSAKRMGMMFSGLKELTDQIESTIDEELGPHLSDKAKAHLTCCVLNRLMDKSS